MGQPKTMSNDRCSKKALPHQRYDKEFEG